MDNDMPASGKQPTSPEDLRRLAKDLQDRADALETLADAMVKKKMKTAMIAAMPMARRGLKNVDTFILRCKAELGGF